MATNRGEQDLGPWHNDWLPAGRVQLDDRTEQPPQSTSVVMYSDPADGRQGHAAWMAFPDPDAGGRAVGMLVAEPKALATVPLALEFREAHVPAVRAASLGLKVGSERPAQVDCCFLEYLCGNLAPPRTAGHHLRHGCVRGHDEIRPASSVFFQALNALIRSNLDLGTTTDGSVLLDARGAVISRNDWLSANLDAPAYRVSVCS